MRVLQSAFNGGNKAVVSLTKRIDKNDAKMWGRAGQIQYGEGILKKTAGFFGLFAPAYAKVGQQVLRLPFMAVRGTAQALANKMDRPLDVSALPPPKPPRWRPQ